MLAKGAFPVLAAGCVVAAALALAVAGAAAGPLAGAAVTGAILAIWSLGNAGGVSGAPASAGATQRDRRIGLGLALSLAAGVGLSAGIAPGPGFFELPRSLWGLLLGVWLVPLVLTSIGFAWAFQPPDATARERLRKASRRDP